MAMHSIKSAWRKKLHVAEALHEEKHRHSEVDFLVTNRGEESYWMYVNCAEDSVAI